RRPAARPLAHGRPQPRLPRRARRQRARAQPRPRPAGGRGPVTVAETPPAAAPAAAAPHRRAGVFSRELVLQAVAGSFPKLDPRLQARNPVMFIVELGSAVTSAIFVLDVARGHTGSLWFVGAISAWLWLTVLFANFAEAIAEGRGKAQANALRAT